MIILLRFWEIGNNPVDVLFILDVGSYQRALENGKIVTKAKFIVNIDHHLDNNKFGDLFLVDYQSSSTGELVYLLLTSMDIKITATMARALYTSLMTDTGGFKYPNTGPRTALILSELLKHPMDFTNIYREYYDLLTLGQTKLKARVIDRMECSFEGRVVESRIQPNDFLELELSESDTAHAISDLTNIRGVEIAILYRPMNDSKVKVSLRSNQDFDVKSLANILGGGGHRKAAGATFQGDIKIARGLVQSYLNTHLIKTVETRHCLVSS